MSCSIDSVFVDTEMWMCWCVAVSVGDWAWVCWPCVSTEWMSVELYVISRSVASWSHIVTSHCCTWHGSSYHCAYQVEVRVISHCSLSTVSDHVFLVAGSRLWNSLLPDITSAPTLTVFGTASQHTFSPDHFLTNCFWFLVLYTVYSSGLADLYFDHCK